MIVLLLFVLSELIMGQVVEPLIYGHSTGLSPIAVIVAATFLAFLWGPSACCSRHRLPCAWW